MGCTSDLIPMFRDEKSLSRNAVRDLQAFSPACAGLSPLVDMTMFYCNTAGLPVSKDFREAEIHRIIFE
ncbi:MAG: hypothetical protein CVU72_02140 [Deltaproteobacteria bacterium HGW-Deltaproteobacteria-7]|nr:MAG: hypothetical protein CVU72_02140 [Deltaproteobacteria bacterium HGW-Deltaproteobacteria-7]PKN20250.1 MAG: hypothetical protein CVU71_00175 [Deltaproteobacteria bacterium HGW-Deltaproteobacteria-6]